MKKIRLIALALIILGFPLILTGCQSSTQEATLTATVTSAKELSYNGEDGKTVYELLKATHEVQADESSMGVLIKSIDGVSQTDSEFWLYDVNGEQSNLSSDKQTTKTGDKIHWQLKGF